MGNLCFNGTISENSGRQPQLYATCATATCATSELSPVNIIWDFFYHTLFVIYALLLSWTPFYDTKKVWNSKINDFDACMWYTKEKLLRSSCVHDQSDILVFLLWKSYIALSVRLIQTILTKYCSYISLANFTMSIFIKTHGTVCTWKSSYTAKWPYIIYCNYILLAIFDCLNSSTS